MCECASACRMLLALFYVFCLWGCTWSTCEVLCVCVRVRGVCVTSACMRVSGCVFVCMRCV